ncbi:helix-turn-helix domain-containing protein [Escherichia coli]
MTVFSFIKEVLSPHIRLLYSPQELGFNDAGLIVLNHFGYDNNIYYSVTLTRKEITSFQNTSENTHYFAYSKIIKKTIDRTFKITGEQITIGNITPSINGKVSVTLILSLLEMKLIDFIADDNIDVRVSLTILNMLSNNTTTIRELAASVYLQEDYLKRIFRRHTGTGLYQFYNWIKLLKAISKIQNHDKIKKIAIELGYSSSSSFNYSFKKEFSIGPRDYIKEYLHNKISCMAVHE